MRRLLLLIALALTSSAALAQRSVQFTWAPGSNPGWTPCTSGTYCLTGFTLYEITTGTPVLMAHTLQTTTTYTLTPLPSKGSHSYELVQDGIDGAGAAVQSSGNPGLVINCKKAGLWRSCSIGKSWAAAVKLMDQERSGLGRYYFIRPRSEVVVPAW